MKKCININKELKSGTITCSLGPHPNQFVKKIVTIFLELGFGDPQDYFIHAEPSPIK